MLDFIEWYWDLDSVGVLVVMLVNLIGILFDCDELVGLLGVLKVCGGYLVVDEIYYGLIYGVDVVLVLEVDDDVFVLNSFFKYFGMIGWCLGWLVVLVVVVFELEKLV